MEVLVLISQKSTQTSKTSTRFVRSVRQVSTKTVLQRQKRFQVVSASTASYMDKKIPLNATTSSLDATTKSPFMKTGLDTALSKDASASPLLQNKTRLPWCSLQEDIRLFCFVREFSFYQEI